jgi:hypothetical protein
VQRVQGHPAFAVRPSTSCPAVSPTAWLSVQAGFCPRRAAGGGHPSRPAVAGRLQRSTRRHRAGRPRTPAQAVTPGGSGPFDLAPGGVYRAAPVTRGAGGLLPHRFTLTPKGGLFSVALSRGSPRVAVSNHPALWSPDVPRRHPEAPTRPPGRLVGFCPRSRGWRPSISACRCRQALAAYPQARAGSPRTPAQAAPCGYGPFGLAPGGVYRATPVTRGAGGLLLHRFTLTGRSRRSVLCGTFPRVAPGCR